jgi:glucose/arabinose dehydrogenase
MALVGDVLYVANSDALVRLPYKQGATQAAGPAVKVADLPGGALNHHWTKNLIASRDGSKLYVGVGSNSNVAENGIEQRSTNAMNWAAISCPTT